MQDKSQENRIAGLSAIGAGLLPAIAVLEEHLGHFDRFQILLFAYLYLISMVCWLAQRAGVWAAPLHITGGAIADAEAGMNSARHAVVLAIFTTGFFGLLQCLIEINRGTWLHLHSPIDRDVFEYALSPVLWFIAWRLALRAAAGKVEFNLGWHWKPIDAIFLAGLSALTWTALMIYMQYQKDGHQPMHVFGVQQGSVAPFIYIGLGLTFSVANALSEELWFRGLLLGALRGLMGMWPAILLQGLVFGLIHWFGTPQGVLGIVLAGVWGILLGWWTYTRRCLWQAVLVHILADFAIWYTTNG